MALINRKTVQNNWKTVTAISLAVLAAIGVGLTCAFFPPAIPAIAGVSFFGFKIFAGLSAMSVIGASFSAAGIAAAATLAGSALVNAVNKVSNLFDNWFKTKKTHVTDFNNEMVVRTGGDPYSSSSLRADNTHRHHAANTSRLDDERELRRDTKGTSSVVRIEEPKTTKTATFYKPVDAVKKTDVTVTQDSELLVSNGLTQ